MPGLSGIDACRRIVESVEGCRVIMLTSYAEDELLFAAIQLALPAYARRFSLRGQVRPQVERCAQGQLPVICYPRCWDSVAFYLGRDDVCTYSAEHRRELIAALAEQSRTLLFVKADHSLEEILRDLPGSLQFVPCGRQGPVRVGLIQPRPEAEPHLFAERMQERVPTDHTHTLQRHDMLEPRQRRQPLR